MAAMKLTPLSAKQPVAPNSERQTPASAGPRTRVALKSPKLARSRREGLGADQLKEEDLAARQLKSNTDSRQGEDRRHLPDMYDVESDQNGQRKRQRH